jgi:hypothetical protein
MSAELNFPSEVKEDGSGNVLIADRNNHRVRLVVASTGIITTFAGTGAAGFGGDGGPATSASLNVLWGLAVDSSGRVLISDQHNHRIRRVALGTGIITTLAGGGEGGDGGPATSARLFYPSALAVDSVGNVIIADTYNHRIRMIDTTGMISTLAGNGMAAFGGDGGSATSAGLNFPQGLALDAGGNVLIADYDNHRIRRLAADTGIITTVAGTGMAGFSGNGSPATSAVLWRPQGIAVDGSGNILIADSHNHRIRVILAVQPSPTTTPPPSMSPSATPYCATALFRAFPRTDLVGTLVGTALAPGLPVLAPTEASCRQACCDAAECDGYSFELGALSFHPASNCYLLVNVTQLMPINGYASGLRESVLL